MLQIRILMRLLGGTGLALLLLVSCVPSAFQSSEVFPEREIVFGIDSVPGEFTFGFIQSDGSGLITRTVKLDIYPRSPVWGADGRAIAFRSGPGTAYINPNKAYVLGGDGRRWGGCDNWYWHYGRVWLTPDNKLLMADVVVPDNLERIVIADPATCAIEQILFEEPYRSKFVSLESAALSNLGQLAVGRRDVSGTTENWNLWVINPISKTERNVTQGLAPAWSNTGDWLAYTGQDGIYIIKPDGTQKHRVVELDFLNLHGRLEDLPVASWSADDQYLIYSWRNTIYKTNITTGLVTEIFRGGFAPNWRSRTANVPTEN